MELKMSYSIPTEINVICPLCNKYTTDKRCDLCHLVFITKDNKIGAILRHFDKVNDNENVIIWIPSINKCTYEYYGVRKADNTYLYEVIMPWLPYDITEDRILKFLIFL